MRPIRTLSLSALSRFMAAEYEMTLFAGGFGYSNCRCRTHLFRTGPEETARLIEEAELVSFSIISILSEKPL